MELGRLIRRRHEARGAEGVLMHTCLLAAVLAAGPNGLDPHATAGLYRTVEDAIRALDAEQDERFLRECVDQQWLTQVLKNVSLKDWRDGDRAYSRSYLEDLRKAKASEKRSGKDGEWAALLVETTGYTVVWQYFILREDRWYVSWAGGIDILWSRRYSDGREASREEKAALLRERAENYLLSPLKKSPIREQDPLKAARATVDWAISRLKRSDFDVFLGWCVTRDFMLKRLERQSVREYSRGRERQLLIDLLGVANKGAAVLQRDGREVVLTKSKKDDYKVSVTLVRVDADWRISSYYAIGQVPTVPDQTQ